MGAALFIMIDMTLAVDKLFTVIIKLAQIQQQLSYCVCVKCLIYE